jgi:ATP-binding cassette subfamily A (ABC1) protein 3
LRAVAGFLPPSSGTALINGYDLATELTKIRENLGLCPQHDILFDTLTVEEHLTFFAKVSDKVS